MLIFAVQQNEIWESLWWEWWVVKQEVQLFEAIGCIFFNVHESLVMKSDWIKFFFVSWRHIL